jgi:phenylpyruvate tautomerase PptA (4-oxalocrotonate tautomerase family)
MDHMPHATLKLGVGYPEEVKRRLADKVAEDIIETLGLDPMWVSVVIDEIPFPEWEQKVWNEEIVAKHDRVYRAPGYDMSLDPREKLKEQNWQQPEC